MKTALAALCLLALFVAPACATEFRTGNAITIGADEVIDDDLMAAGNSVVIQGKVNGDVLAAGQTVRVTGPVGGSVMAAGQDVIVTGDVDGSARVAGRSVTLGGLVKRNAQAAGQTVVISETADIKKDVHVGGNSFDLDGTVGRLLGIAAQNAAVRGMVGGDLRFEGDALSLGPAAKVGGELAYRSETEPEIAQGATIAGGVRKLPPRPGGEKKRGGFSLFRFTIRLLMVYAFGAVGLALLPRIFRAAGNAVAVRPWWNLFLGFLVLVVTPVAVIVAMITVVGIPLGALALIAWVAALLFSGVPVGAYLGGRLLRSASPYLALFVGLLVLALLGLIPYLGFITKLVTLLIGLAVYARATKGLIAEMRLQRA
jgi:cytoskeletal protein CcmA (bactofilin family)